jgi:hypothetical protein
VAHALAELPTEIEPETDDLTRRGAIWAPETMLGTENWRHPRNAVV